MSDIQPMLCHTDSSNWMEKCFRESTRNSSQVNPGKLGIAPRTTLLSHFGKRNSPLQPKISQLVALMPTEPSKQKKTKPGRAPV